MRLSALFGSKKSIASTLVLALVIGAPITLAIVHEGFPISDVELNAKDVWVTNGISLVTGRLNMQISELNGGVTMASRDFDVMQDGDDVFVYDKDLSSIERIDPAYTNLGQRIALPPAATVSYGKAIMTIVDPRTGELWTVPTSGELQFDPETNPAVGEFGEGAQAIATRDGSVWVASPLNGSFSKIAEGGEPEQRGQFGAREFFLTAVGDRAVALDTERNELIFDDGTVVKLPEPALRLQQAGAARDFVVVATGDSLLKVGFDGSIEALDAEVSPAASSPSEASAPVVLGECIHGAWASGKRYLGACEGKDPYIDDIPNVVQGSVLEFRVNKNVIALNNVLDGNTWLVTESMVLVDNWEEVTPPDQDEGEEGDEKASQQSFEDTLAERTEQNRPPIARPDEVGVRPGKTTIIRVLDNDTDPDGDVLTILGTSDISGAAGTLQYIDGNRALQFVPAAGATGTVSFRYTVTDGRAGGVAEAQVNVLVRPMEENVAPVSTRVSSTSVEAGQTISYNVLADWVDPDGDDLVLVGASPDTADVVRFTPDGLITFTHTSSELGDKTVTFSVSDGREVATGELVIKVAQAGTLNPIGTPDFGTTFVGDPIEIAPLDNDLSPSGASLSISLVEALTEGATANLSGDTGLVTVRSDKPGTYYFKYTLAAGITTSIGIIRVDVLEDPDAPLPPIAVKDTAYLRPNEPTLLPALNNDVSPAGRVLGIQSIDLGLGLDGLSVEILNSTMLRITAPSGMTEAVEFTYTISDGITSSTAGITVVPVPELSKHQAPIAANDTVKVRVGDIASVHVLDNDFHPDGARMILEPELVQTTVSDDGLVFVSDETVRLQAPSVPGTYTATYKITDAFNESSTANVIFTVLAIDKENNAVPIPRPLTARVFAGAPVTVDIPLDGIDADGDSVVFVSAGGASLGEIAATSSTALTYEAYPDSAGTDEFSYEVRDALGASATGVIRVGVIPRPDTVLSPTAVDDVVAVRPGRVASIPVMSNDSDPNGYSIEIVPELLEVQEGITASVDDKVVVVEAGEAEGTFILRYEISNGNGGTDDAFVKVNVSTDAPVQPPSAIDHVIELKDVIGAETVDINVLDGAQNPGGLIDDLVISLEGPNAGNAEPLGNGIVRVTLGDTRQAVTYTLTNEVDELSASAFLVVPAYTSDLPPYLDPALEPQVIRMNGSGEWRLEDILIVPSGRDARIIEADTASAGRANGDPLVLDEFRLAYKPETDFRGQTMLTFKVTDGSSASDESGSQATISLPITVGDPNMEDVPPTFSNSTAAIESDGTTTTIDLRSLSAHPSARILGELTYSDFTGATSDIQATLSGSTVSISSEFGVQPGASTVLNFTVNYGEFTVPGQIEVRTVDSTRPLAQTTEDIEPEGRASSTYVIDALANDFNPFAAVPKDLTIVGAEFESTGPIYTGADVSFTSSAITVATGTTKSGTLSVIYTVRDATDTQAREVQGRLTVVVASAPEPVTSITATNPSTQRVDVVFQAPASSNGAEITGYTVTVTGAGPTVNQACSAGVACVFTGRTNGQINTITVSATNKVGTTVSGTRTITTYGTPGAPSSVSLSRSSSTANSTITPGWAAPGDTGGGAVTYNWSYTAGTTGGANGTGSTSGGGRSVGAGTYTFQVQACNAGGLCGPFASASTTVAPAPPTATLSRGAKHPTTSGYYFHLTLTNYPAGTVGVVCYNYGGSPITGTVYNLPSNFNGDLLCYSGFPTYYVTVNGVQSNVVNSW